VRVKVGDMRGVEAVIEEDRKKKSHELDGYK
jgi:hypothetical protein